MLDVKVAKLSPKDLAAIRAFEQTLESHVCLLAVEREGALYVLEAKLAPNLWERVDAVYPGIDGLRSFYKTQDEARDAKAALKNLLNHARDRQFAKRPIRIRLSVPLMEEGSP
jgi:hypothetical protein